MLSSKRQIDNIPNIHTSFTVLGNHKGLKFIKLSDIRFDEKIADMVQANNAVFPSKLLNNLYAIDTFALTQERLDHILKGYDTGLPPIYVEESFGSKYTLINGRHRLTATILRRDSIVPSVII